MKSESFCRHYSITFSNQSPKINSKLTIFISSKCSDQESLLRQIQMFSTWSSRRESKTHSEIKTRASLTPQSYPEFLQGTYTILSVAYSEPYIVIIESYLNKPTMPFGYGRQQSINLSSFNDLNLPMNPFNVMTPVFPAPRAELWLYSIQADDNPIHPQMSEISNNSTPPLWVSTVDAWQTSSGMVRSNQMNHEDYLSPPAPPQRRFHQIISKADPGGSFSKKGGVPQHTCEACGQSLPRETTVQNTERNFYHYV